MTNVICPNCGSVVPALRACLTCYASFKGYTKDSNDATAASITGPGILASTGAPNSELQMDPRLHRSVWRRDRGIERLAHGSMESASLPVIARVTDVEALAKIEGVRIATTVAPSSGEKEEGWIVSAHIPLGKIEDLRRKPFVKSLKESQKLRPCLESTVLDLGFGSGTATQPLAGGGAGVIVGIVDFGMDFMHRNFRKQGGGSRVLRLWDQSAPSDETSPEPFGYGRVYSQEEIDSALGERDPYEALGYAPPPDNLFMTTGAHGTYVADVAAGNGGGSGAAGVAPNADIVFVDISTIGIPVSGVDVIGQSFGDTKQLLDAVMFIFEFAAKEGKPCVINLSLGTNGGPHDGRTLVEMGIDRLLKEAPGRAVVIAASNLSGKSLHASGRVEPSGSADVLWRIFQNDTTLNEVEIWYDKDDVFEVEVIRPDERIQVTLGRGGKATLMTGADSTIVVVNRQNDPNTGDNVINVSFERAVTPGLWTLRLHGVSVKNGQFHVWVERDETGQSRLQSSTSCEIDDECTLGSIACGEKSIVVGCYDAHEESATLGEFSSSGPTRDGRQKPEVSAPGENVLAARSRTLVQRHKVSGTSIAAPAVTGIVALMLAEASRTDTRLDIDTIRALLIASARQDPPTTAAWDKRYGYGRVSALQAVALVADWSRREKGVTTTRIPELRPENDLNTIQDWIASGPEGD